MVAFGDRLRPALDYATDFLGLLHAAESVRLGDRTQFLMITAHLVIAVAGDATSRIVARGTRRSCARESSRSKVFCPFLTIYSARSGHTKDERQARALAGPAAQLARQAPGGTYLAGNQVVVNIDELNLRRRHTSLLHRRHDLLLGETLELFS